MSNCTFVWQKLVAMGICVMLTMPIAADEAQKADPTAQSLKEFNCQGISFSTSPAEFARRFPQQLKNSKPADEQIGLKTYVTATSNGDGISVHFLNGKLFQIDLIYQAARLNEMGGIDVFTRKLVDRLGAYDDTTSTPGTGYRHTWNRPCVNRRAEFSVISSAVMVSVIDTAMETTLKELRAKNIDLGF